MGSLGIPLLVDTGFWAPSALNKNSLWGIRPPSSQRKSGLGSPVGLCCMTGDMGGDDVVRSIFSVLICVSVSDPRQDGLQASGFHRPLEDRL